MERWRVAYATVWLALICLATAICGSLGINASIELPGRDAAVELTSRGIAAHESTTFVPSRLAWVREGGRWVSHTTSPPDPLMKRGVWFGEVGQGVHQKQKQALPATDQHAKQHRRATQTVPETDQHAKQHGRAILQEDPSIEQDHWGTMSAPGPKQRTREISRALSQLAHALVGDGLDNEQSGLPERAGARDIGNWERRCEDDGWEESWETWSSCSATCQEEGAPYPSRSRARVDGCPGVQRQECNFLTYCPVDCDWDDWSDWSDCSHTCEGQQTRIRILTSARHGGSCTHKGRELRETKKCNSSPCPVDCRWGEWGAFGDCGFIEKTCDVWSSRYRYRVKTVNEAHGGTCMGDYMSSERCQWVQCPVHCQWQNWDEWGECSLSCGSGERARHRRIRQKALHGGHLCKGQRTHVEKCNTHACPVDCIWGEWGEYTVCTKSCGGGAKVRSRDYQVPVANGGVPCSGDADELLPCNVFYCPVDCMWDDWGAWSACSASCGGGTKTAFRSYVTLARWGGSNRTCPGSRTATANCNESPCPASLAQSSVTASLLRRH